MRVLRLELCTIHPSLACADYDDGDHEDNVPFRLIEPLENVSGVTKEFFDINERVLGLITLASLRHNFFRVTILILLVSFLSVSLLVLLLRLVLLMIAAVWNARNSTYPGVSDCVREHPYPRLYTHTHTHARTHAHTHTHGCVCVRKSWL